MQVLITGATGFTGGHLARTLAGRGYRVRALVRQPDRAEELVTAGVEPVTGDFGDPASLRRAVADCDVIYHLAAVYRQAGISPAVYRAVNTDAVGALMLAAIEAGVPRFVHCSTVGVHGDIEHPPADEDAPFRPGDVYQETKLAGERLAHETAARRGGIELVVVRPTGIYGPGDRRLLKLFRGVAHRRFVTLGSGEIYYHLTYIDDLVEGFRLCGETPGIHGRTYILAGAEVNTLNELVRLIAEEAGVKPPRLHLPVWPVWLVGAACEAVCVPLRIEPPLYRRRVDFFTKSRAFDISRARAQLGYAPAVDLRSGIRRTLDWYRQAGWL
jgi:nucleoside-diphosphate-sugar epimerase